MRIGILTFHKVINYGAFLQAFSLSNMLQKQFPNDEIEIVDYVTNPKRRYLMILRSLKKDGVSGAIEELRKISVFNSAQKHLPLSPTSFHSKHLNELYSYIDERYDMLIIGSDAVFNWNQTKFPTAFIPDYQFSIPVYTYAASVHGLRFYSVSQDMLQKCGRAFDRMKYVGVRDKCSEQFVKLCSDNAKIIHCCDPTLFIDKDAIYNNGISVRNKLEKRYGFSIDSKYIVAMAPDSNMIKKIRERYGNEYKIISVYVKSSYSDYYIADLNPFEWTVILRLAALVVTSYFHGTLLSLVQGTPTIVIDYSGYCDEQYEGKLKDLMVTRFDLSELYYDKKEAVNFVGENGFYNKVDKLLGGEYKKRISDAVKKESKTLNDFIKLLGTADDQMK